LSVSGVDPLLHNLINWCRWLGSSAGSLVNRASDPADELTGVTTSAGRI